MSFSTETDNRYTNEINVAADGAVIMQREDQLDYLCRSVFLFVNQVIRQGNFPGSPAFAYEEFRHAYTIPSTDEPRPWALASRPWALAPTGKLWNEPTLESGRYMP